MKVVFIGGINVPSQGGIENYVINMASQLIKNGHEAWIICRGVEKAHYESHGIEITKVPVAENSFAILVHNFKASLVVWKNWKDIDVVNYQSIYLPFLYEWIPKLRGIKVCHTQHSFAQDNPKHGFVSKLLISTLYRISGLIFSPIITVSERNKALIRSRLLKTATVINCGVDIAPSCEDTDIINQFEIKAGKYYLTIGRIDPVKNLHVLIKAFLKHSKDSDYQLVIAGNLNNNYAEELKKLANGDERIIFTGPVYGNDKETLLHRCMAYCLVSMSEGFPIALLEAMSHGKICLCSDIPANRETLTKPLGLWSKVGDDVSLFENMHMLETSPEQYAELGDLVKKRILDNLTWDKIGVQYIDYLKSNIL